jgi:hypothetical protein
VTGSRNGFPVPPTEWVVCLGVLREVVDKRVDCPVAKGNAKPFEECFECRHLAVHSNDRGRESCSTDDSFS